MNQTGADISKYVRWIQEGKSFSAIREDLTALGFAEADIKKIIHEVDDELLQSSVSNDKQAQAKIFNTISRIALGVGALLVIAYLVARSMTAFSLGITCLAIGIGILLFQRKVKDGRAPGLDRERRKFNLRKDS